MAAREIIPVPIFERKFNYKKNPGERIEGFISKYQSTAQSLINSANNPKPRNISEVVVAAANQQLLDKIQECITVVDNKSKSQKFLDYLSSKYNPQQVNEILSQIENTQLSLKQQLENLKGGVVKA